MFQENVAEGRFDPTICEKIAAKQFPINDPKSDNKSTSKSDSKADSKAENAAVSGKPSKSELAPADNEVSPSSQSGKKQPLLKESKEDKEEENRLIEAGIAEILKTNSPEKPSENVTETGTPDNSNKLLKAGFDEVSEEAATNKGKSTSELDGAGKEQPTAAKVTVNLKGTGIVITHTYI